MIKISQVGKNAYSVVGATALSHRQLMKFNIFLSALADVTIERSENEIELLFSVQDEFAIAQTICQTVDFLKKQTEAVECDEQVLILTTSREKQLEDNAEVLDQLKLIQENDSQIDSNYNDFCSFCDRTLKITLRSYQYKSAFLLSTGKGGFDFSVPGAGKTIITYATYAYLKSTGVVDSILVVGPASSYNAWYDEYKTCFGVYPEFENLSVAATNECKIYLAASAKYHKEISFVNVEKIRLLTKDICTFLNNHKALLIIDEAHKIKSPEAKSTKAAMDLAKYAGARILLTGTPMPNGYEDLYSLTKTFSPFVSILPYNYAQLKNMTKNNATEAQAQKIRACVLPYYSRISKKYLLETGELLPPVYHLVECEMDEEQSSLYHRLDQFIGKLNDHIDEDLLLSLKKAVLIRKMQISSNPALLKNSIASSMDELKEEYSSHFEDVDSNISSLITADKEVTAHFAESSISRLVGRYSTGSIATAKNRKAVEIAADLVAQGKKVLIWDIFVKNMEVLKMMLEEKLGACVEMINGSVFGVDRQAAIKRFREGSSKVLLANPATLAESISLHKTCQNAIYVNRNFNAAQFIQSKDRIHRINMPAGTTANYYFILNKDSVDLSVDERLTAKEQRMLAILDADDIKIGGAEMEDGNIMSSEDIETSYAR